MFRPFFAFIGYRYTRVKRSNHFISFISTTSMVGIALGVMVLITVLSVMNGFHHEIRSHMLSMTPHITLQNYGAAALHNWQPLVEQLKTYPKVKDAAPYVAGHAMVSSRGRVLPMMVIGIESSLVSEIYDFADRIVAGSMAALTPRSFGVMMSKSLADRLLLGVGDSITLLVPDTMVTPLGVHPRLKRVKLVGIFESATNIDYIFLNIQDASTLYRLNQGVTGIQIRIENELYAGPVAREINKQLDYQYFVSDWTERYAHFFEATKMEKTVMWCILLLIIMVAAFNLVSSLVMMVTDKCADIAILRTMGASKSHVMGIFVVQGAIIGTVGTIIGLGLGLLLAYYVTDITNYLQYLFDVQFISEEVYFIGYVPSDIETLDVVAVCVSSLVMSVIATIYPAWRAANIQPAEALRYD